MWFFKNFRLKYFLARAGSNFSAIDHSLDVPKLTSYSVLDSRFCSHKTPCTYLIQRRVTCTADYRMSVHNKAKRSQIMSRALPLILVICFLCGVASAQQQPGTAEKIGEKIDRGLTQMGTELSQAWAEARKSVEKMGVQGRVYGRLHWDKALEHANVDIDVRDGQVVLLKGKVDSAAAKQKAEQLARDTVGVNDVVNELAITSAESR